jgi:outer membrane lipoprotein carrier protein
LSVVENPDAEDIFSMKMLIIFVLLLTWLPATGSLANDSPEVPLAKVIQALETPFRTNAPSGRAIRDFQADFIQQAYLAALERVEEGSGRVAVRFDRDGQRLTPLFRWEYTAPTVQEIISDGRTVWVYLPENSQVLESVLPADGLEEREDPLAFLTGLGELSKRFRITWASPSRNEQGDYRLLLQPLRPSSMVEQLVLTVDSAAVPGEGRKAAGRPIYPVRSATIFGPSDSRTTIVFRNIRLNQGLADDRFTFAPPEGVEVLRPEQGGLGF